MLTVTTELYGSVYCLEQLLFVDTSNDKVALVDGFGALGTGADADGRERMAYTGEEATLFGKGATITYYGEGVHLKTVVVVEAEGLVLDDTWVELET